MLSYSGYFFIKELNNTIKNNEQTFVHVKKTAEYYGENNLLFNEHISIYCGNIATEQISQIKKKIKFKDINTNAKKATINIRRVATQ